MSNSKLGTLIRILVPALLLPPLLLGLYIGGTFLASEFFGMLPEIVIAAPLAIAGVIGMCVLLRKKLNYTGEELGGILVLGLLLSAGVGYYLIQMILKNFL